MYGTEHPEKGGETVGVGRNAAEAEAGEGGVAERILSGSLTIKKGQA